MSSPVCRLPPSSCRLPLSSTSAASPNTLCPKVTLGMASSPRLMATGNSGTLKPPASGLGRSTWSEATALRTYSMESALSERTSRRPRNKAAWFQLSRALLTRSHTPSLSEMVIWRTETSEPRMPSILDSRIWRSGVDRRSWTKLVSQSFCSSSLMVSTSCATSTAGTAMARPSRANMMTKKRRGRVRIRAIRTTALYRYRLHSQGHRTSC